MELARDCICAVKPNEIVRGPTCILVTTAPEETTIQGEGEEEIKVWKFDQYRFTQDEYENLKNESILPVGAVWDANLRGIERSGLHEKADTLIAKANDYIECGSTKESEKWYAYRTALRSWKIAVRETKNQPGYPQKVEYPEMPSIH